MTKLLVFEITDYTTDKYRNITPVFVIAAHISALYLVPEIITAVVLRLPYLEIAVKINNNSILRADTRPNWEFSRKILTLI
jgi:hypothetical protein